MLGEKKLDMPKNFDDIEIVSSNTNDTKEIEIIYYDDLHKLQRKTITLCGTKLVVIDTIPIENKKEV
ncbi:MAG: hypothetical protein ACFFDF_00295 [Candidatus Odinarchaeota archaeon]